MLASLTLTIMFISAVYIIIYSNYLTAQENKKINNTSAKNKLEQTLQEVDLEETFSNVAV